MRRLLLSVALTTLCACATVVRGAKDTAKFESDPAGATVTVESISDDKLGPFTCVTPCELELKRKRDWNVVFTLDGFKPATGTLTPKVTGGGVASGVGNVLAGGIIGIGVDAGTGANLDLRPNPMVARLTPTDSTEESMIVEPEKKRKSDAGEAIDGAENDLAAEQNGEHSPEGAIEPAAASEAAPGTGMHIAPLPELKMDPVDSGGQQ